MVIKYYDPILYSVKNEVGLIENIFNHKELGRGRPPKSHMDSDKTSGYTDYVALETPRYGLMLLGSKDILI